MSGILERHPRLRVSFGECRIGWIPFFVSWMDRQVAKRDADPTAKLTLLPSEYFARQITATFEDDLIGAWLIPEDWAYLRESAMWGSDYPHPQGLWPNTDEKMAEMFTGVDAALRDEIVFKRAARLFKVQVPETIAQSLASAAQ
jgi:uncharacterized protein